MLMPSEGNPNVDPATVESLVLAASAGMEQVSLMEHTTAAEVLSAVFTLLDRTLTTMHRLQDPKDRLHNIREIARVLEEMKLEHGTLPQ